MTDDWRLQVKLSDRAAAHDLARRLEDGELEHELADAAGDRVIVSGDERCLFLYSTGREQAERAQGALQALASGNGWTMEFAQRRWHPEAEDWEDPDQPLPADDGQRAAEHAALVERERAEAQTVGWTSYEVRVACPSHRDTVELAERLRDEGLSCVRRWRYLLLGAGDEDTARVLADRLQGEVPPGSTVTVEGSLASVAAATPANPFVVFGGLGV